MVIFQDNIKLLYKGFNQLSTFELYDTLSLRNEVFISEQKCSVSDLDNKDQHCYHVLIYDDATLVACSRLVPAGGVYSEMSVGRVVVRSGYRQKGLGKFLMLESIRLLHLLFGKGSVRIGAQADTRGFYERIGFAQSGEIYTHGGIKHVEMLQNW